jgi:hypothetical protein
LDSQRKNLKKRTGKKNRTKEPGEKNRKKDWGAVLFEKHRGSFGKALRFF